MDTVNYTVLWQKENTSGKITQMVLGNEQPPQLQKNIRQ